MSRKDWLNYSIPLLIVLAVIVFFRCGKSEPAAPQTFMEQTPSDKLVVLPAAALPATAPRDDQQNMRRVAAIRESFKASQDYGMTSVSPTQGPDKSFVFSIAYNPVSRGCQGGDVDLIARVIPPKGRLLFTVDSDTDRNPVHVQEMTLDGLKNPFKIDLKIPPPKNPKVYRVTLCSNLTNSDDCKQAAPAPMKKLGAVNPDVPHDNWIFFAQTFIADPKAIKLLDNTRQDLEQKKLDPGLAFGKMLADSAYLKQLPQINSTVKPAPATFRDNTLTVTMYYRDIEACKALGVKR